MTDTLGANTRIFKNPRYEDMIEELSLRFDKQSATNVLDIKWQNSELEDSLITRISNKKKPRTFLTSAVLVFNPRSYASIGT